MSCESPRMAKIIPIAFSTSILAPAATATSKYLWLFTLTAQRVSYYFNWNGSKFIYLFFKIVPEIFLIDCLRHILLFLFLHLLINLDWISSISHSRMRNSVLIYEFSSILLKLLSTLMCIIIIAWYSFLSNDKYRHLSKKISRIGLSHICLDFTVLWWYLPTLIWQLAIQYFFLPHGLQLLTILRFSSPYVSRDVQPGSISVLFSYKVHFIDFAFSLSLLAPDLYTVCPP